MKPEQIKLFPDSEIYIPSQCVKRICELIKKLEEKKPERIKRTLSIKDVLKWK